MISTSSAPIVESSAFGSKHDAEPTTRVTCDFTLPNCDHSSVFGEMYLRTNRTNHTKIMRCFPHCCPHHRERSYCGSSVHVIVRSTASVKRDQLLVYGRFRPMHTDPLACGTRLAAASIEASLQSKDPSKGQWIESKATKAPGKVDKSSQLFEINSSGRWYYPWSGAATIAMRLVEHIFEAHVFRRVGSNVELVAVAGSTPFRLMSFRRGSAVKEDVESPQRTVLRKRKAIMRAPSPTAVTDDEQQRSPAQAFMMRPTPLSEDRGIASENVAPPSIFSTPRFPSEMPAVRLPSITAPQLTTRSPYYRPAFPDVTLPLRALLNPAPDHVVQPLAAPSTLLPTPPMGENTLSALSEWLHEWPATSVDSRWLFAWERNVAQSYETQITTSYAAGSSQSDLVPALSALEVSTPSASYSTESYEHPLNAIDTIIRLLLHLWLDQRSSRASAEAVDRIVHGGVRPSGSLLVSAHGSWVSEVVSGAQQFLHNETTVSWSQLRTLALSRASPEDSTNHEDEFGYRSFVAKCRQQLVLRHHRCNRSIRSPKRQRGAPLPPRRLLQTARVWRCRITDVAVQMDAMNQLTLSLLSVVQFWKHLSYLRFDYTPAASTSATTTEAHLTVASVFNSLVSNGCFTKLTLDGQYRWFNCLPSGEPTIGTMLMGYVVGDYVGRATGAGTIHITTYMWPTGNSEAATATAFACHWTLDAASLSGDGISSTVVSVVVESASVSWSPHAMETMSMGEKLRCVDRWQHACDLQLAYSRD